MSCHLTGYVDLSSATLFPLVMSSTDSPHSGPSFTAPPRAHLYAPPSVCRPTGTLRGIRTKSLNPFKTNLEGHFFSGRRFLKSSSQAEGRAAYPIPHLSLPFPIIDCDNDRQVCEDWVQFTHPQGGLYFRKCSQPDGQKGQVRLSTPKHFGEAHLTKIF